MKYLFILLLLPSLAHADWLKVPRIGDGTCCIKPGREQTTGPYRADTSVLPKAVTAWSGQPTEDGLWYIIQVGESFLLDLPTASWAKPTVQEITTEFKKRGLDFNRVKPLPTKIGLLKEKLLRWFELSLAWALSGSDTFNRSDVSPLDGSWTILTNGSGVPAIVSNHVQLSASEVFVAGHAYFNAYTSANDQQGLVNVTLSGASQSESGVLLRTTGTDTDTDAKFYFCNALINGEGGRTSEIWKDVSGVYTILAQETATTWAAGDELKCAVSGTNLTLYRNSGSVITASDSAVTTGQPGIRVYTASLTFSDAQVDNFSSADIAAVVVGRRRELRY